MNLASDLAFDFINGVDQKKSKHILRPGKPRKGKTQRIKTDVYFSPLTERTPSNYHWYVFFYVFDHSSITYPSTCWTSSVTLWGLSSRSKENMPWFSITRLIWSWHSWSIGKAGHLTYTGVHILWWEERIALQPTYVKRKNERWLQ